MWSKPTIILLKKPMNFPLTFFVLRMNSGSTSWLQYPHIICIATFFPHHCTEISLLNSNRIFVVLFLFHILPTYIGSTIHKYIQSLYVVKFVCWQSFSLMNNFSMIPLRVGCILVFLPLLFCIKFLWIFAGVFLISLVRLTLFAYFFFDLLGLLWLSFLICTSPILPCIPCSIFLFLLKLSVLLGQLCQLHLQMKFWFWIFGSCFRSNSQLMGLFNCLCECGLLLNVPFILGGLWIKTGWFELLLENPFVLGGVCIQINGFYLLVVVATSFSVTDSISSDKSLSRMWPIVAFMLTVAFVPFLFVLTISLSVLCKSVKVADNLCLFYFLDSILTSSLYLMMHWLK